MDAQIFEYLREPERLHVVHQPTGFVVHIVKRSEGNGCRQVFVERVNGRRRAIEIFGITSHFEVRVSCGKIQLYDSSTSPCVPVALEDLGTQDIGRRGDVESVLLVESDLGCVGRAPASEVAVIADERKCLRANIGASRRGSAEQDRYGNGIYTRCSHTCSVKEVSTR